MAYGDHQMVVDEKLNTRSDMSLDTESNDTQEEFKDLPAVERNNYFCKVSSPRTPL
jgi:hypothetical protein